MGEVTIPFFAKYFRYVSLVLCIHRESEKNERDEGPTETIILPEGPRMVQSGTLP